jgi:hypothetical protein
MDIEPGINDSIKIFRIIQSIFTPTFRAVKIDTRPFLAEPWLAAPVKQKGEPGSYSLDPARLLSYLSLEFIRGATAPSDRTRRLNLKSLTILPAQPPPYSARLSCFTPA